jgi:hypothetical protein
MKSRLKKTIAGIGALAALALGGAAISQATPSPPQKSPEPATGQEQGAPENSADDQGNGQDEGSKGDKAEAPDKGEKAGSETPNDDGPGGHADEPAILNADHQRVGQE